MRELHDPSELQRRTELYVRDEENAGTYFPRIGTVITREFPR